MGILLVVWLTVPCVTDDNGDIVVLIVVEAVVGIPIFVIGLGGVCLVTVDGIGTTIAAAKVVVSSDSDRP